MKAGILVVLTKPRKTSRALKKHDGTTPHPSKIMWGTQIAMHPNEQNCDVGWEVAALTRLQRIKTKKEVLARRERSCRQQSNRSTPSFWVDPDPIHAVARTVGKMEKNKGKRKEPARDPWDCYKKPSRKHGYKNSGLDVVVGGRVEYGTYKDFPYKGAHLFRDRLYDKRLSYDSYNILEDAVARLVEMTVDIPPPPTELEEPTVCALSAALRRKARAIVKLLRADQRLKAVHPLPKNIVCGSLRSTVRSMYPLSLTVAQELSIKSSTKVEAQPCGFCEAEQKSLLDKWKKARRQPVSVDQQHLEEFRRAFSRNVPEGWDKDKKRVCWVPNGHASDEFHRSEGGNWNRQEFCREPRVELVYSAGKPRIVTLYSSYNTEVLKPLHDTLYTTIKRKGWLLVGSPTYERLKRLSDGCDGRDWLSFDYSSATDNIKLSYVRAMVDVLKQKSVGMSVDEINCLDVLGDLRVDEESAHSGQPMGSLMSFPLLCLANKTVVDMALSSLLTSGKIDFREWSRHRCLINGDDLLTKDTSSGGLVDAIVAEGSKVGLVVNKEKTMRHPELGEINSTVFKNCVLEKKTNVSALWMGSDVSDVLGFAREATTTPRGFRMVVLANASRLARQKIKTAHHLPGDLVKQILTSKRLKHAISAQPSSRVPELTNLFPVETMPDGFALSWEEKVEVLTARVNRVRDEGQWRSLPTERRRLTRLRKDLAAAPGERLPGRKIFKLLQPKKTTPEKTVLSIFAREWERKRKEELLALSTHDDPTMIVSDLSGIDRILDAIRYERLTNEKLGVRAVEAPVHRSDNFISFEPAGMVQIKSSWISSPVMDCDNVASRYVGP